MICVHAVLQLQFYKRDSVIITYLYSNVVYLRKIVLIVTLSLFQSKPFALRTSPKGSLF